MSPIPSWIEVYAERVQACRGDLTKLDLVLREASVPMILVDDERRYLYANPPALSLFGKTLEQLRELRIDDLSPDYRRHLMLAGWERLMASQYVMGHEIARADAMFEGFSYFGVANVLPGRHVVAFAAADAQPEVPAPELQMRVPIAKVLTPRELEVLALASRGLNGPAIADALVLTSATVRTHFTNIYRKLDVGDRAAAVAKAMRLGLIQ